MFPLDRPGHENRETLPEVRKADGESPVWPETAMGSMPPVAARIASLPQRLTAQRQTARAAYGPVGAPEFCRFTQFFTNGRMLRMCKSRENTGSKFTRKPLSRLSTHVCPPTWGSVNSIELWPARKRSVVRMVRVVDDVFRGVPALNFRRCSVKATISGAANRKGSCLFDQLPRPHVLGPVDRKRDID
jgi:hypothetical protein